MKYSLCTHAWAALSLAVVLLFPFPSNAAANADELAAIKAEMAELKAQYAAQLNALEQRLTKAESELARQAAAPAVAAAPPPAAVVSPPSTPNAFNPAISLVLIGNYAAEGRNPDDYTMPGFPLPDEAGPGARGFSLGESELTFSANVDDKFYGSMTTSVSVEDGDTSVDLEEAYFQTLALPYGLIVKGGRFFSRIGYLNERHPHADDFVDRPLAYQAMLNGTLGDDGLQLRWLAPTDRFLEFGAEAYRGDSYPAAGADHHGVGTWTVFSHLGDDIGTDWSYRVGASYVHADAEDRATGDPVDLFSGTSELAIVDAIFKWAPDGDPTRRNLKIQGEFLQRWEDGRFDGIRYDGTQQGFYVQSVYQFMPRFRFGARLEGLFSNNDGNLQGTALDDDGHDPWRASVLFEFDNSEFSRLRLQYAYDDAGPDPDHELYLNYVLSIGAHGAHQF